MDNIPGGIITATKFNTSAFITGLEENTKYSVSMRTVSTAAVGEPSSIANQTTLTDSMHNYHLINY